MRSLLVALVLLVPALVSATHGSRWCAGPDPALGIVQVTSGSADATFYVDDRNFLLGNGVWLYQEHNGAWTAKLPGVYLGDPTHADLQRGGSSVIIPASGPRTSDPDICTDDPNTIPDQLLL